MPFSGAATYKLPSPCSKNTHHSSPSLHQWIRGIWRDSGKVSSWPKMGLGFGDLPAQQILGLRGNLGYNCAGSLATKANCHFLVFVLTTAILKILAMIKKKFFFAILEK